MKPMLQSRYVGWMAVRPLQFGDETFEPGDRVPQKHLDGMRDPEVLVRTGRLAAVAKDMNKVPRYLRKDVAPEDEKRETILAARAASQIGPVVPRHLVGTHHDPTSKAFRARAKAELKAAEEQAAAADLDGQEEPLELKPGPYPVAATPGIRVAEPVATHGVKAGSDADVADDYVAQTDPGEADDAVEYVEQPALNATTEEWALFAIETGQATEEEVDGKTRTELIEKYQLPEDEE